MSADILDLFARTADGVMAVDPTCRIILWNRAAESLLGYPAAQVVGRACHDVFQGHDVHGNLFCHPHCPVLVMARRDELAHAYDVAARAADGTERWLNVSTVLVPSAGENIVIHLFRDVTSARGSQTLVQAVLDRLQPAAPGPEPPAAPVERLTPREQEILKLLAGGEGTGAIARRLFVSTATVRNHTQNILTKLGVHSRLEAVAFAFRHRLM